MSKTNYEKLENSAPKDWQEVKLGEVAEIIGGGTPKTSIAEYWDGNIAWLTPRDLSKHKSRYISNGDRNITKIGLEKSSAKLLPKGTILLSTRAPVGYLSIANEEISTNQGFRSLVCKKEKTNNLFLFYLLKNNVKYLQSQSEGTTFGELAGSTLKSLLFLLPPPPEQKAIAEVLSSLDDKIDLLQKQNQTLENIAQTLFRKYFIQDKKKDWEKTIIENVCQKINSGGTPQTKISEYYGGKINWYSTKELNDSFLFESINKLTEAGLENSNAKLFPKNTIVLAIYAAPTVGRLGILANDATFNQAACGFVVNENKICFEYLYLHLLLSRKKLLDMSSGSAQQNLNVTIMKEFEILLPPKNQMENFCKKVKPIFIKIKTNQTQIQTLEKLRNSLLPKLISGKIRIKF